MKTCWPRQLLSIILLFSFSYATGADGPSAPQRLARQRKSASNGASSRKITTLFSGDSIQTRDDSVATLSLWIVGFGHAQRLRQISGQRSGSQARGRGDCNF